MSVEIIDCVQGTEEWYRARMGIPTASTFHTILAKGGVGRATYMRKLAYEIITGDLMENYSNASMERGKAMEAEARNFYELVSGYECRQVGFVRNGDKGCSPDSLIDEQGMLEIKTARGDILIEILQRNQFPTEHIAQCQGGLWICEREWLDLSIYWPKMPPFRRRITRDDRYIRNLELAVERFNEELAALVDYIKKYGEQQQRMAAA